MVDRTTMCTVNPQELILEIRAEFPFEGYMAADGAPYLTVADVISRYLQPGQRIFDFGSGPCDKTAVASKLGMVCTAYDDLRDNWHREGDNRRKIRAFAESQGIRLQESFNPNDGAPFDLVMLNDVLENLPNSPRETLIELIDVLKTGGFLFVTVPNFGNLRKRISLLFGRTNHAPYPQYFWYQDAWRGPFREYVRGDLVQMGRFLELELMELTTRHHMLKKLPSPMLVPFYKAFTRVFPGVADTWVAVFRKPGGWSRDLAGSPS